MITEFKVGKKYVCDLKERGLCWNISGKMDFLLDGKPHLCVMAESKGEMIYASFEEDEANNHNDGNMWIFWGDTDHFTEYID